MTSYRSTKNNIFSTHALHIFVNEISSPTYTALMFVLYDIIQGESVARDPQTIVYKKNMLLR